MSQTETFDFVTALKYLKDGFSLKRSCWTFDSHICLNSDKTKLLDEYSVILDCENYECFLSYEDVVSTDWTFYKDFEKESKNAKKN